MTIKEYLRTNSNNHLNQKSLVDACEKELGYTRKTISNSIYEMKKAGEHLPYGGVTRPTQSFKTGLSEEELRAKHDTNFIVKQAVKSLQEGVYLVDSEFIKQCNLRTTSGYRSVLDHPDFKDYRGRAGSVVYWSHPKSINKLKQEGVLA
jgi:hypothetical protein